MSGTNAGVELISRASTRRARLRYCRRAEGNRTQSLRILEPLENQHLVAGSRPRPPRGVFSSSRRVFELGWLILQVDTRCYPESQSLLMRGR